MKPFLYILAGLFLVGPFLAWTYLIALGCAFQTNSSSCGIDLRNYLDVEFISLAAIPWIIGIVCLIAAKRR